MYKYDITITGISFLINLFEKCIHMSITIPIVIVHILQVLYCYCFTESIQLVNTECTIYYLLVIDIDGI